MHGTTVEMKKKERKQAAPLQLSNERYTILPPNT